MARGSVASALGESLERMPIYEYVCSNCGTKTDILHGINDPAPAFCPTCGAEGTLRKQFAPPTIHYRGSGWAKKDRSSSSGTRSRSSDSTSGSEGGDGKASGSGSTGTGSAGSSGSSGGKGSTSEAGTSTSSTGSKED